MKTKLHLLAALFVATCFNPGGNVAGLPADAPVTVSEDASTFGLANGFLVARIDKKTGTLASLKFQGVEMLALGHGGGEGGYWSSVGRGKIGSRRSAVVRIHPATNGGARAEISCRLFNNPKSPDGGVDVEYRYALGRGEQGLYVTAVLEHKPGYPSFGVGEARYCLKLNPAVFDYMTIDANRRRVMPSGYDWDHGAPLNLKEARRMTTGIHKGEVEHKYDYSAVLAETPAYGWSSTKKNVGLWLVNPSMEYLGGGPTKAELTGHLDVNPGGLPTLLNMWVGSHYGGTTLYAAPDEAWTKVVGPFLIYCNSAPTQEAMWQDALAQAVKETAAWPYAWAADKNFPAAAQRGMVSGRLVLRDPLAPDAKMSNVWVGVTAPDYVARSSSRYGTPPVVDWQRDAKFYQFWTRADGQGTFTIPNVRAGSNTLHAIADGVLGEFTLTNVVVTAGQPLELGELVWTPVRFGRMVWEIGVPDRTAREFRHGDDYWHWGLYFDYPKEFPKDVNFVIGQSDWRRDWNYVQPPRIESRNVAVLSEDEEQHEDAAAALARTRSGKIRSTTWTIRFQMPGESRGRATLRLAFCGTHQGCNVEVFVNGKSVGETGTLPSTSAMQRDGIRAYWVEKDIAFDGKMLKPGANSIQLLSHAEGWSQGVMYDYLRL
ncbi:MAG: polysaccharide lyase family protein, partial [Verrucomicrobia bacterium]|nr:polysaccharide lyase family protein [Verrucomicrobiota bacterium]